MCVCVYIYIYTHTHYILFTHFSLDEHLGYFLLLAIVNSAAMNIEVHVSFPIRFFFPKIYAQEWDCWITHRSSIFRF